MAVNSFDQGISFFGKNSREDLSRSPKGRLLITELRIPFVWDERQYFKRRNKDQSLSNAGKKYVVFCIIYTENDMQSTQKVMIDSSMADVVFNELIEFSSITPTTRLFMEVFCYACSNGNKNASPVHQLSKKLSRSLSRAFGRRLNANYPLGWMQHSSSVHADLHAADNKQPIQPLSISSLHNFTKIAEAVIHVDELVSCEEGRSHILTTKFPQKGLDRNSMAAFEVPLFGSFSFRTAVQPYCATRELQVGRVYIQDAENEKISVDQSIIGAEYYCTLVNTYLYCYNANRDRRLMEMAIRIDQRTKIFRTSDNAGLEIEHQMGAHILTFSSPEERRKFMKLLLAQINEISQWSDAALNIRDLKIRTNTTKNEIRRRGSLYDEIPVSMQSDAF